MSGGCPFQAGRMQGGFESYTEKIDGRKIRERSQSFFDHFSQAKLFFNSQSEAEKNHLTDALCFEIGKVETLGVRERMIYFLLQIDEGLAAAVAYKTGMHVPQGLSKPLNQQVPADADPQAYKSIVKEGSLSRSAALSMANSTMISIQTRKVAILACDDVRGGEIMAVRRAVENAGGFCEVIAPRLGYLECSDDHEPIAIDKSLLTTASVFYDAVYVPGGGNHVASLAADADAIHFLNEAFKHCKPIAAVTAALPVIAATYFYSKLPDSQQDPLEEGIIIQEDARELATVLIEAMKKHRFWNREKHRKVPA
ncbi:MAG: catalase HPII, partial [Chitinophagaceae bacterium]